MALIKTTQEIYYKGQQVFYLNLSNSAFTLSYTYSLSNFEDKLSTDDVRVFIESGDFTPGETSFVNRQIFDFTVSDNVLRVDANIHQHPTIDPIQRGLKLYDRQNNKFEFEEDLICTVVYFRDFSEIPEPARYYMNIKAARLFVDRLVGDQALRTYTKEDETRARSILMETDLVNGDHNMLRGDPSLTSVFDTYNPSSALIR